MQDVIAAAADHYEAVYQNSDHARRIAGETPEMAHAHHEAIFIQNKSIKV